MPCPKVGRTIPSDFSREAANVSFMFKRWLIAALLGITKSNVNKYSTVFSILWIMKVRLLILEQWSYR